MDWVGGPKLCLTLAVLTRYLTLRIFPSSHVRLKRHPPPHGGLHPCTFLPFSPLFGGRFLFQASPEACHSSFSAPVGQQNPCKTPHPPLHPTNKH